MSSNERERATIFDANNKNSNTNGNTNGNDGSSSNNNKISRQRDGARLDIERR